MRSFIWVFVLGIVVVFGGCDLQPKISSIPDSVGDFISERYPTLLAEPDSEIYKTAVADYGVYASPTVYGNGDVTDADYVLYSPADDYTMPDQDEKQDASNDIKETESNIDEETPEEDEDEEQEISEQENEPDLMVDDLKIPDYVNGKPVEKSVEKVEEKKVEVKQKATEPKKTEAKVEKTPEPVRAQLNEITVEKGDTLYSLSRKYSVPVNDLAVMNKITPPFALAVGQKLKVPDVLSVPQNTTVRAAVKTEPKKIEKVADAKSVAEKSERQGAAKVEKVEKKAEVKEVKKDVKPESKKPEVKKAEVKPNAENKKVEPVKNAKKTDAKPQVKPKATDKSATKPKAEQKAKTEPKAKPKAEQKQNTAKKVEQKKTDTKPKTEKKDTKKSVQKTATPQKRAAKQLAARSSSKFSWPVRGKILSGYGSKPNGLFNDGINIKTTKGAVVSASENGIVAYAGNEVKGMGNLVIIQHADGWMTVYAHMDSMCVKRGSTVVVGQKIGTVGSSGRVDQSQLHFEIRKGTRAYNPINYLKK